MLVEISQHFILCKVHRGQKTEGTNYLNVHIDMNENITELLKPLK
jgi:hypothetical protein